MSSSKEKVRHNVPNNLLYFKNILITILCFLSPAQTLYPECSAAKVGAPSKAQCKRQESGLGGSSNDVVLFVAKAAGEDNISQQVSSMHGAWRGQGKGGIVTGVEEQGLESEGQWLRGRELGARCLYQEQGAWKKGQVMIDLYAGVDGSGE